MRSQSGEPRATLAQVSRRTIALSRTARSALVLNRMLGVKLPGDNQAKNPIADKLQSFIDLRRYDTGMGKRQCQQTRIGETMPQPLLRAPGDIRFSG